MSTLAAATQNVIDAIATKAQAAGTTANETLYLAKAVQSLASMSTSVGDVQALAASLQAANSAEAWLASPANQTALALQLQIPAAAAYLTTNTAVMAALFASPTGSAMVFGYTVSIAAVTASAVAQTALLASSTGVAALLVSPSAVTALFGLLGFLGNFVASSTAMAAVLGSMAAVDTCFSNGLFRAAVWASDAAVSALQAAPVAIQRLIDTGRANYGSYASSAYTFVPQGSKALLLRRWYSSTGSEIDYLSWNRSTGTATAPNGRSFYGTQAYGCSTTYASDAVFPVTNNAAANLVLACNGLQRTTWSQGAALYVYYLIV